ncbi:MAG TPA: hypothetical protein VLA66_02610 [Thermoanaerobaculia bacterium]|nr:hypothetical protein [Thermoanaerobaculia bacterium]
MKAARDATAPPLALVRGDRTLAEPAAQRLAAEIAAAWQVEPETRRHVEDLAGLVQDLRTYSLFAPGRVVVAVETGVLADRDASASLLAEARSALPWQGTPESLEGRARVAALRLLQVLRLHDLDAAAAGADQLLAALPDETLTGRRGRAGKKGADELRAELAPLLTAALAAGLRGVGETEGSILADLLRDGAPERHLLILVESSAADGHPLVEALGRRGAVIEAGRVESGKRGGFEGLDRLVEELAKETGRRIRRDAAAELARRTLRAEGGRGAAPGALDADSTERFAAEYRKLAGLAGDRTIDLELVSGQVEDRGEQDVWQILDAIGAGRAGEALAGLERRLSGSSDPVADRLSFFALLASFARHLLAVRAIAEALGVRRDESSYPRFKERLAPKLQGEVEGLAANPVAKLHPFRLFKAYSASSRFASGELARLPSLLLDTELRLKGESGEADAALAELVVALARPGISSGRSGSAESRRRAGGGGRS